MMTKQFLRENHFLLFNCIFLALILVKQFIIVGTLLVIISWLFTLNKKDLSNNLKKNKTVWLFIAPFIMYCVGMLYSSNLIYGLKDLETKSTMVIFPIIFASATYRLADKKKELLLSYLFGTTLIGLISLIIGFINNGNIPTYEMLDAFLHPGYLAMHLCLASVIGLFVLFTLNISKIIRKLIIFSIISCSTIIWLTTSKSGIITWSILLITLIFYWLYKRKAIIKGSIVTFTCLISLILVANKILPGFNERFSSAIETALNPTKIEDISTTESSKVRVLIWNQAIQLARKYPLLGTGTGDVKDELLIMYEKAGMTGAFKSRLNAHNQYLQTLVAIGSLGLILLLVSIFIPSIIALKYKNIYFLAFIIIISINLLFESMLEKQSGVIFYSYLGSILFFGLNLSNNTNNRI